jgi:NTP pyrophosphatase (non-canonical NTP hydrolase)
MSGLLSVASSNSIHCASVSIADYEAGVAETDVLDPNDLSPILQGLYGEVGGIMSTAKKHIREGDAYPGFARAAEEEFGDTLWYLAALCRRTAVSLKERLAMSEGEHSRRYGRRSRLHRSTQLYSSLAGLQLHS